MEQTRLTLVMPLDRCQHRLAGNNLATLGIDSRVVRPLEQQGRGFQRHVLILQHYIPVHHVRPSRAVVIQHLSGNKNVILGINPQIIVSLARTRLLVVISKVAVNPVPLLQNFHMTDQAVHIGPPRNAHDGISGKSLRAKPHRQEHRQQAEQQERPKIPAHKAFNKKKISQAKKRKTIPGRQARQNRHE